MFNVYIIIIIYFIFYSPSHTGLCSVTAIQMNVSFECGVDFSFLFLKPTIEYTRSKGMPRARISTNKFFITLFGLVPSPRSRTFAVVLSVFFFCLLFFISFCFCECICPPQLCDVSGLCCQSGGYKRQAGHRERSSVVLHLHWKSCLYCVILRQACRCVHLLLYNVYS